MLDEDPAWLGKPWENGLEIDFVASARTFPQNVDARSRNHRSCGRDSCGGQRRSLLILDEAVVEWQEGLNDRRSITQGHGEMDSVAVIFQVSR